jgi:hypothetical protein
MIHFSPQDRLVQLWSVRWQLRAAVVVGLALAVLPVHSALGHGMSAGDKPLVSGIVSLKHLHAGDVISLFSREQLPAGARLPRAARAGTGESLLPAGIDALLPTGDAGTLTLVGNEDVFLRLHDCLRILDVPMEITGPGRQRVVLTLVRAEARTVRAAILRLPGRGTAASDGHQLVVEGSPEWLHRALREVVREELQEPRASPPPAL